MVTIMLTNPGQPILARYLDRIVPRLIDVTALGQREVNARLDRHLAILESRGIRSLDGLGEPFLSGDIVARPGIVRPLRTPVARGYVPWSGVDLHSCALLRQRSEPSCDGQ